MYRRTLLALFIVGLLAPLMVGFGPPLQEESPITIQIEAGYGRRFRAGGWTPLLLTLSNDGPDVSGALRVRAENNTGLEGASYSTLIDLPRQSRKQVFLYVALQGYARQILVELVDTEGNVLQTGTTQTTLAGGSDILTAVVTDSPGGSIDLSGIALGDGTSHQVNWAVENIPPRADALLALDVLVFSDVDTGRLTVEQQTALAGWVAAGGHLIVSGGPNYRLTSAALADLLPVELTGTTTVDDLTPLATYAGRYADSLAEPDVILATGALRPGAEALVTVADVPLLVRRAYGEGLVDFLAADPGLAPFRRWPRSAALWEALVVVPQQQPSWSAGIQDWPLANRVVEETPGFDLPTVLELIGLLAGYILIIGPLNYIVLRLLNRREWAWVTIPVLVVAFSILAYATGFSLRGTRATLNRLAVVQVWAGGERAQVDGLVGVLAPRRDVYQLTAGEGFTLRPLPQDSNTGGGGGFTAVQRATEVVQGDGFAVRDLLVDASYVAGFAATGFIEDAPPVTADVTLDYTAGTPGVIQGSVTNTLDEPLQDAVVLVRGSFQWVGTLEPGQTVDFTVPLTGRRSAPLSLVGSGSSSAYLYQYQSLNLTTQDIMGPSYSGYSTDFYYYQVATNSDDQRLRQRQDFLDALAPDVDYSGGRGDRVYLAGWTDSSPLDLTLEGVTWEPEDMTLWLFELPVSTVEAPAGAQTVTPDMATWLPVASSTVTGAQPYNLNLNGGEQVTFRYMPLASAQLADVTGLDITARRSSADAASIYIWDWEAETWELVDLSAGITANLRDVASYVGPSNAVELRVVPDNVNGFVVYDQVDVTWHGTF